MVPYLLLAAVAGGMGLFLCERQKSSKRDMLFLLLIGAIMIAMVVMRGSPVGLDYEYAYRDYFIGLEGKDFSYLFSPENIYRTEPGFTLINLIVAMITPNPMVMAAVVSALIIILRLIFIYRQSKMVWFSVFLYITFGFFGYALCTLRQELGISVMLFALPYLQKRKLLPYLMIVALAALFHTSLWIMIPVYFVANLPLNKITIGLYSAGALTVLLFSEPMITFFIRLVPKYQSYAPDTYFMQGRDFNTVLIPGAIFIVVCCMYRKLVRHNPQNLVLINLYTYATVLFLLTMKHFIIQRIALLFLPIALILLPEIVQVMLCDQDGNPVQALSSHSNSKAEELRVKKIQQTAGEMYRITLGMFMAAGVLYFLFLLSANRLGLVPYVTFWQ